MLSEKDAKGRNQLNMREKDLASWLIPTGKASPSINGFKLRYCHILLLTIIFVRTEKQNEDLYTHR